MLARVITVLEAEKAIMRVNYELTEKQKKGRHFSRSLYVVKDIEKGEKITEKNVRSIRPGYGMHPKFYKKVLGASVSSDLSRGHSLNQKDFFI